MSGNTAASRAPLAGVRIVDLSRLLPGPMCTLYFAQLGADVIKVEDTGAGDYARNLSTREPASSHQCCCIPMVVRRKALDPSSHGQRSLLGEPAGD